MAIDPQTAVAIHQLLQQWSRCGVTHLPSLPLAALTNISTAPPKSSPGQTSSAAPLLSPPAQIAGLPPTVATSAPAPAPIVATSTAHVSPPKVSAPQLRATPTSGSPEAPSVWPIPSMSAAERESTFRDLRLQVAACTKCSELACSRTQTVFGVGNLTPRIAFFGEAPGADEDKQGEPFVGRAGQLLNKIIQASKLKREDVFILNALRCRPPNNRTPTDAEIENCRPFFERQLEVLQPEYIVCLGAVAVRAVLRSTESVGRLRGRFHSYRGSKVMVTYHPSYLLRNEGAKKFTWEDMQMLMRELGIL